MYKHIYSWKIIEFEEDTFLLPIKNSYKGETQGTINFSNLDIDIENKYLAILICTNKNLPNLCIRPAYLNEKIANLFLRFDVKLKNQKVFNSQFILESNESHEKISRFTTEKFIEKILNKNGFHLEINKSSILLKFEKEANIKDTLSLLEISKVLQEVIKTHYNN